MKKLGIAVLGILFSTSLLAEDVMYCVSDIETGFVKDSPDSWLTGRLEEKRYTVRVIDDFSSVVINGYSYTCEPSAYSKEFIVCENYYNNGESFRYLKSTGRFIKINSTIFGNVNNKEHFEIDAMRGGKC